MNAISETQNPKTQPKPHHNTPEPQTLYSCTRPHSWTLVLAVNASPYHPEMPHHCIQRCNKDRSPVVVVKFHSENVLKRPFKVSVHVCERLTEAARKLRLHQPLGTFQYREILAPLYPSRNSSRSRPHSAGPLSLQ